MTLRTSSKTMTFHRSFCLGYEDRLLPPGDYRVVTDEELIEGLSFQPLGGYPLSSLCRRRLDTPSR